MEPEQTEPADNSPVESVEVDSSSQESSNDTGRMTMAEAFAAARAEVGEDEPERSTDSKESDSEPEQTTEATPEVEQPAAEQPEQPAKPVRPETDQGVLDRIRTLVMQGRESELDPVAQGVLQRLRAEERQRVLTEQQETEYFRRQYLEFERQRIEDPDEFSERVLADPSVAQFMRDFKAAYPDISLDNPTLGPRQPSREEIVAEVDEVWRSGFEQMTDAMASNAGLSADEIAQIKFETGRKPGATLARLFNSSVERAVKAQLDKEIPKIQAAEREAAEKEAQAKWANQSIIAPRSLNGLPSTKGVSDGGANSFARAFQEAVEELSRSGTA